MLELLCLRVISAPNSLLTTAALIPLTLFAAIEIPIPVPQQRIPRVDSPLVIEFATL